MVNQIFRAKYTQGVLKPLEPVVGLKEGAIIYITILPESLLVEAYEALNEKMGHKKATQVWEFLVGKHEYGKRSKTK